MRTILEHNESLQILFMNFQLDKQLPTELAIRRPNNDDSIFQVIDIKSSTKIPIHLSSGLDFVVNRFKAKVMFLSIDSPYPAGSLQRQ